MKPDKRAYFLLIGFFYFLPHFAEGQDQKLADSLIALYEKGEFKETKYALLYDIAVNLKKPEKKLEYSELLIEKASDGALSEYLYYGHLQKGNALQEMGNNAKALEAYFQSLNHAHSSGHEIGIGSLMIAIADTYSIMGNSENARNYYNKGIQLLRRLGDSVKIATALLNAGDEYVNIKKYDSALVYFKESGVIFKNVNYLNGTAYNQGNTGMVYAEQGRDAEAEQQINEAIEILEELEDYYPISVYLTYMADIYARQLDFNVAFGYLQRSLDLASAYGLKDQMSDANLKLSQLYETFGDYEGSHRYYKQHIAYRDSVQNIAAVQQMANMRTNYEVSQKQVEVDLLNQQKKTRGIVVLATGIALFLIGLLALGLFRRNRYIKKTNRIIAEEKDRSENLLLNILPAETAEELKEFGKVKAHRFESVSVLFTDFAGFTHYSEHLKPEALVESVDFYFSKFDEIIEKHGLEKIKTVGDAYMCAGGLPFPSEDHAYKMLLAAFDILAFVEEAKRTGRQDIPRFDIRIGVNSGPVVAGVVGTKKFSYDIWGDTVNVASRMESMSAPGKINISENTFKLVREQTECQYRGKIEVKNRGMMKMYFVERIKSGVQV